VGGVPDADPDLGFEDCVICILQCCGSGMFIPDPDFYSSGFSDPGSRSASLVFIIFFRILIIDICLGGSIRSARGGWGDDWGDDWGRVL
jgi:hypothetical protein